MSRAKKKTDRSRWFERRCDNHGPLFDDLEEFAERTGTADDEQLLDGVRSGRLRALDGDRL